MKYNLNMKQYLGIKDKTEDEIIKIIMYYAPVIMAVLNNEEFDYKKYPDFVYQVTLKKSEYAITREKKLELFLRLLKENLDIEVKDIVLLNAVSSVLVTSKYEKLKKEEKIELAENNFFVTDKEIEAARNK